MTTTDTPRLAPERIARLAGLLGSGVASAEHVASGAAGHAFRVRTGDGTLIVKVSRTDEPDLFRSEADALAHLGGTATVHVPVVRAVSPEFLVMQDLGERRREVSAESWYAFGAQVGRLHQVDADAFGYEHDNFIGIWRQRNPATTDWVEFYYWNRLRCFLDTGHNKRVLTAADRAGIERVVDRMRSLLPPQRPGLCHGDLWIENIVPTADGRIFVIDPAVHFGLPEADLAMTHLYGGFPDAFYDGYRSAAELLPDWTDRAPLHQLKEQVLMVAQFEHPESLAGLRETIARFG